MKILTTTASMLVAAHPHRTAVDHITTNGLRLHHDHAGSPEEMHVTLGGRITAAVNTARPAAAQHLSPDPPICCV